jgi:hypothetical protein
VQGERDTVAHAHRFGRSVGQNGGDTYLVAEAAYWLFVLCMLREIAAPEAVLEHLERCAQFDWARKRLATLRW